MHLVHNIKSSELQVWRGTNILTISILIDGCRSAGGQLSDCL